ncbi:SRPBCC domain-containing protein [uncultured Roseibium sp.]|uniref:SRPBCC family protein n=1 Tax=uncultured Roseibium sp. TaxID=1936171 RepID=UPI00261A3593|nr:SRPBCC domain-containing protein [uncultured Roseibium sp.]
MRDHELTLEQSCTAPAARVWDILVRPNLWWGDDVLLEPHAGGAFHEPWRDKHGQHHTRGRVQEIEVPRLLRLSWRDDDWPFETEVSLQLVERGEGSLIVLAHRGWSGAPETLRAELVSAHRGGWQHHLKNLSARAEAQ